MMIAICPQCANTADIHGDVCHCPTCRYSFDTPRHVNDSTQPWEILTLVVMLLGVITLSLLNSWR